jgi:hypothetical protein
MSRTEDGNPNAGSRVPACNQSHFCTGSAGVKAERGCPTPRAAICAVPFCPWNTFFFFELQQHSYNSSVIGIHTPLGHLARIQPFPRLKTRWPNALRPIRAQPAQLHPGPTSHPQVRQETLAAATHPARAAAALRSPRPRSAPPQPERTGPEQKILRRGHARLHPTEARGSPQSQARTEPPMQMLALAPEFGEKPSLPTLGSPRSVLQSDVAAPTRESLRARTSQVPPTRVRPHRSQRCPRLCWR